MTSVAVIGTQWGDEGKGKIVDWLTAKADIVVRFQGGHNAGHTLVVDGKTYKLNLLPSGVIRQGTISMIGNGVVVDPWQLLAEIDALEAMGSKLTPDRLEVSESACLILPWHKDLDAAREEILSDAKIGTTKRGIGPAYEDKVGRRAIRVSDLGDPETLDSRLARLFAHHAPLRAGLGLPAPDINALKVQLLDVAQRVLPYAKPVWRSLQFAHKAGKKVVFEGAQGAMLDVDHGTYPFVTSSNTHVGQASVGSGIGPTMIGYTLGLVKAYTTRVGSGPFPTELHDDIAEHLSSRGHEFGTVTGRARRCGWFDAVAVRGVCAQSGVSGLALTKIDVLDGLDTLKICVGYTLKGEQLDYFPPRMQDQANIEPIYEEMPGWQEPTEGITDFYDLPVAAQNYIRRIEALVGVPSALISTSPRREDTITIREPFEQN